MQKVERYVVFLSLKEIALDFISAGWLHAPRLAGTGIIKPLSDCPKSISGSKSLYNATSLRASAASLWERVGRFGGCSECALCAKYYLIWYVLYPWPNSNIHLTCCGVPRVRNHHPKVLRYPQDVHLDSGHPIPIRLQRETGK